VFASYTGGSNEDVINDVKFTGPNEITVTGYSKSQEYKKLTKFTGTQFIDSTVTSGVSKLFINKFDTIGNKTWGTLFGGSSTAQTNGWNICMDNLFKLYITGRTDGNINMLNINGGMVYSKLSALGVQDSYIISFDSTNTLIWNTYYGGTNPEGALSLDFNPDGDRIMTAGLTSTQAKSTVNGYNNFPCQKVISGPYSTAWYNDNINADIISYTTVYYGPYDGYIGWFSTAIPVGIKEYFMDKDHSVEDLIQIFPNPASDNFFVAIDKSYTKNVKIDVYDESGKLLFTQTIPTAFEKTVVPLYSSNLKNGIYFVTVSDEFKTTSKKVIIAGH
jgi:hypothetical protein